MKIRQKPVPLPHFRHIHPTYEGGHHPLFGAPRRFTPRPLPRRPSRPFPIKDSKFFRVKPSKKGKKK